MIGPLLTGIGMLVLMVDWADLTASRHIRGLRWRASKPVNSAAGRQLIYARIDLHTCSHVADLG